MGVRNLQGISIARCTQRLAGLLAGTAVAFMVYAGTAEAARQEVVCVDEVLMINEDTNPLLKTGNTKQRVEQALAAKLAAEEKSGKLPFEIKKSAGVEYEGVMSDVDAEVPVALVPLAIMSDTLDSSYRATDNKQLYKSVVVGSLYLVVCRGGSTANNWTMVGAVPVSGFDSQTLGVRTHYLAPPTAAQKAEVYASMMEKLIQERLDFGAVKPYLKNITKPADDTYEVVDVSMTAKRAPEIFGNQQEAIKALVGSFYSARFQETSRKIVYPPITMMAKGGRGDMSNAGTQSVADDVSDSIYSLTGGYAASGATMTLTVPKPTHRIGLNFSGAAWQELPGKKESTTVKNVGYKAWLRSQVDGAAEKVADDVKSVQYILAGYDAEAERAQLPDIFTELLVRLTDRLASGKK